MKLPTDHRRAATQKKREATGETARPVPKRSCHETRDEVAPTPTAPAEMVPVAELGREEAPRPQGEGVLVGAASKEERASIEVAPRGEGETSTEVGPEREETPMVVDLTGESPSTVAKEATPGVEHEVTPVAPKATLGAAVGSHLGTPPSRVLAMNSGHLAGQLLERACLPQFREEQPIAEVLDVLNISLLRIIINNMHILRSACLRTTNGYVAAARAQVDDAARELAFTRAREAAMADELRTAKEESRDWEKRFEEAKSKAASKIERAKIVKVKLADAMVRLGTYEDRLEAAQLKADEAKECIEKAEAVAQAVEERAIGAEADARSTWERAGTTEEWAEEVEVAAQATEERVIAIEGRAEEAVEQYKGSTGFVEEVTQVGLDAYFRGLEDIKEKVAQAFNIIGLEDIQLGDPEKGKQDGHAAVDDGSEPNEP